MTRKNLILTLFLLTFFLSLASPALAHDPASPLRTNYCSGANHDEERCLTLFDGAGAFISEWGVTLAISVISIISMVVWFLDRAALALFEFVTGGTWLLDLKTDFIEGIASFLPDVLRDTAFGEGGLMYIALVLAGLLMIVPTVAAGMNKLVKPQRVMIWGVLLSVLFVGGTVGYDLIDQIENLRQDMMQNAIGSDADYGVEKLILVPMHAQESEAEMQLTDISTLPSQFMTSFFPEVVKIDISVRVVESGWFGVVESEIESPESKLARIAGAVLALFYSLLGFFAAIIVFLSGISFVLLGVAALFLILFLFAALPLGFFEFGETVLRMIMERYVQVVIYSLGIAIFVRLAGGMVDQLPNLDSITTLLEWLLLMIVFYLSLRAILKSSFGLLSASFNTMSGSMGAVWSGAGPATGPSLGDRAKQVAGGAVSGALMMGGPQGAMIGAAATLFSSPMMMRGTGTASGNQAPRPESVVGDVFENNGAAAQQRVPAQDQREAASPVPATDIFAPPPDVSAVQFPQGAGATAAAAPRPNNASATARTLSTAQGQSGSADKSPFGPTDPTRDAAQTARTISSGGE
jgi:hypothetical protein